MAEEKHHEKKEAEEPPKNSTLSFIFLAALLILVLLGIVFIPRYFAAKEKQENAYNGFDFTHDGEFWFTVVSKGNQPFSIPFYYHPKDLEDIVVEEGVRDKFFAMQGNGSIFVAVDPEAGNNKVVIAGVEVAKITGDRYGLLNVPTKSAFLRAPVSATVNTQTPILNCANATSKRMIVAIIASDKNLVSSRNNCIVLESKNYNESIRVADRAMYHLLGIMN
jgi:hypothetical protein